MLYLSYRFLDLPELRIVLCHCIHIFQWPVNYHDYNIKILFIIFMLPFIQFVNETNALNGIAFIIVTCSEEFYFAILCLTEKIRTKYYIYISVMHIKCFYFIKISFNYVFCKKNSYLCAIFYIYLKYRIL